MRLRRRLAELEARVEALEAGPVFNGDMPPRPTIDTQPVDPHALWRDRCADYSAIGMEEVPDDRCIGVYI